MSSFGEVLAVARRARGLTQNQLAGLAGVTQAALSRYESGMRAPDPGVTPRLAAALGVTADLLEHAERVQQGMAMEAHMRRRATAPPSVWKRLEADLNMLRFHTSRMFEQVALHAAEHIPSFDPLEVTPSAAARMVRMQWRMPIGPVRSLTRWLESAGCLVVSRDFETARVDGLSQWAGATPVMLLNSRSPTDRLRLTMAHELGHLVLHSEHVGDDVESEATAFAAEFLMPADLIRPSLRNLRIGQLRDLKQEWGVSMQALIERAFGLGLLSSSQRTTMYKTFSARGWRTVEPYGELIPPESATLAGAVGAEMGASGLSPSEIAAMAGFATEADNTVFRSTTGKLHLV